MPSARDYQLEAVAAAGAALQHGNALVVMATGSGKSITAAEYIRQHKPRTLIVVPRAAIIDSFVRAVREHAGITPTIAASSSHGVDLSGQVVVGMWQTLSRRPLPDFDLVIADECHRIGRDGGYYDVVAGRRVLGFTATPFRQDGYIYGPDRLFPAVTYSRSLSWTTEQGYTVKAVLRAPLKRGVAFEVDALVPTSTGDYLASDVDALVLDDSRMKAQVSDIISQTRERKKIAIACANIAHAQDVADCIRHSGHDCETVVSTDDDRTLALGRFERDECRFLTFVSIVAEGYDYPPTDCIVFLRPTRSSVFYVQCVGRGLRPSPGKTDCLVLDYGSVVRNCGPLDAPIVNRGTGRGAMLDELTALSHDIIQCKDCGCFLFPDKNAPSVACTECGSAQPKPERVVDKNLEKRAEKEAALYSAQVARATHGEGEWEVTGIRLEPATGTQWERRTKKWIIVDTAYGALQFMLSNPAFASTSQLKYFFTKVENELRRLVEACTGKPVNLRAIDPQEFPVVRRVMVKAKKREVNVLAKTQDFDKFISHRILDVHDKGSRDTARLPDMADEAGLVLFPDANAGHVR